MLFSYFVLGLDSYLFINELYFDLDTMHHLERFYVFGFMLVCFFALFKNQTSYGLKTPYGTHDTLHTMQLGLMKVYTL